MVLCSNGVEIHLADSPCVHAGTLGLMKPEWRPKFRKAWAMLNGKHFYACWLPEPESRKVILLFEDGDIVQVDASQFKYSPGV